MILLTGATGYLGSHLLQHLVKKQEKVIVLKRSTSDLSRIESIKDQAIFIDIDLTDLSEAFKYPIERVIHTATVYGRKGESISDLINTNIAFPIRLAELSEIHGIKAFYNTSTSLDSTVNPYSLSKFQFTEWLSKFQKSFRVINIVPEYFYGPGDDNSKFIGMLIEKMSNGTNEIALSPCTQQRDFIYIDDVISAYDSILSNEDLFDAMSTFEVGSGSTLSLKELVLKIATLKNFNINNLKFGAIPLRENECIFSKANIQKLQKLNWKPSVSLDSGLKTTISK
ncbi:NAD-dependent epimerase/dehydratase family protein [Marinoscillum pacificum]|uniref:NAD-dependent epimerase/dehydratase family protein n=1 Tax=Marinoscillum pacificum TaxID=392723 RepID=UPI0021578EA6|nr:NAD(P)-dependent oxidoreductase [Marinoscillum pacificum]